ncbi:hypothetical protein MTO96_039774, partial [Rhipicephalus appendiculatus]
MADKIASSKEHADQEIPSSAKSSVTTGTESRTKKSTAVTVVYANRGSTRSSTRGRTRLTRPQRRKRATSSNVEDGDAVPSSQGRSKKQERRDDAPTRKRVSVVQRALS